ncbi:uncharacterized protein LOC100829839 [Brachypodium distachyon]|uniref:PRLI-interacting factor A n=1 Tax=Brachypodium distachyon TaxID=15368 RepID=I1ISM2_BRADI|nr:uncharacterized protein LOC100829839 [Brachypodium distachyon]KQJ91392.1 hypothetical protein BRADI_4g37390v3 [Brachypodium distachyon]|eukprot:XP_003576812.1 uncharacterized protein LOC100829839 [Brachypodium distachyon]
MNDQTMMMRPLMPAPPLPYQVWAAALAQQQQPPVGFAAGGKPARPARKRQHQGWKRKAAPAGAARWGGSAAPRNTTSYLIRAKRAGGVASLVSPCPVTPAVLPTPRLSPAREVLVEMAKEAWGVDGYGSMKGLIRLRSQAAADAGAEGEGVDSGSGESDVEEHVEVERRLDHDLSRFEMVQLPAAATSDDEDDEDADEEARAARLEEENLTLRARLFLMERDMADIRRRLLAVEALCRDRHRDGCVVDAAVPSESPAAVSGDEAGAVDAMIL